MRGVHLLFVLSFFAQHVTVAYSRFNHVNLWKNVPIQGFACRENVLSIRGGFTNGKSETVPNADFAFDIGQAAGEKLKEAYDTGIPTQVTYGFIFGYYSGFVLKKVGERASFALGLAFVGVEVLNFLGYIDIHHSKLKDDIKRALDINNDGDVDKSDFQLFADKVKGFFSFDSFSSEDTITDKTNGIAKSILKNIKRVCRKAEEIVSHSAPAVGGFAAGFFKGLQS